MIKDWYREGGSQLCQWWVDKENFMEVVALELHYLKVRVSQADGKGKGIQGRENSIYRGMVVQG